MSTKLKFKLPNGQIVTFPIPIDNVPPGLELLKVDVKMWGNMSNKTAALLQRASQEKGTIQAKVRYDDQGNLIWIS